MNLTRADIEAIIEYVYWHCRTNPNGRAYKVWERMRDSLNPPEIDTKRVQESATEPTLF